MMSVCKKWMDLCCDSFSAKNQLLKLNLYLCIEAMSIMILYCNFEVT